MVESEKEFFQNKKFRGSVYDPFKGVLYEIQRDWKEIKRKKKIFYKSSDIAFIKFINPFGFSGAGEFEGLLTQIWGEIQKAIEIISTAFHGGRKAYIFSLKVISWWTGVLKP